MSKVAVITDSNSGITQSQAKELGIRVLPMPFNIGEKTYFEDIEKSKNEDKINQVNQFEQCMSSMVTNKSLIDFEGIAKEVFIKDRTNQKEFLKRLKTAGIPFELKTLSNGKIQTRTMSLPSKETRLKLANGMELAIPEGLSEEEVRKGLEEVELTLKGKEVGEDEQSA